MGYKGKFLTSQLVENAKQQTNVVKARNSTLKTQRTHYHLYDSFARVDSVSSLGNCETNNAAYTVIGSNVGVTWGIQSNSAYVSAVTTAGRSIAYQELNESDCVIEVNLKTIGTNNGLSFRVTDANNFWLCSVQPTNLILTKYVGGTATNIITVSRTFTDCKMSILLKGNKIEVYIDGFLMARVYDSFNATATKHGLFSRGDSLVTRWDNFCVKPLSEIPYDVQEGFENNLSAWYWTKETAGLSYSQTFNTSITKNGGKSFRVELHKDDPLVANSKRSEIALPIESPLEEHWYGVSIYLPNGGDDDYAIDVEPEAIIQWHNTPDSGEEWTSPPLALLTQNGRYQILQLWDPNRLSTNAGISANGTILTSDIGAYIEDKGKWVDWVFHVRWGWNSVQNPITEVYKDGKLVYEKNGIPNMTNDQNGIFSKLGIYKWGWKEVTSTSIITKRVIYYDDYFIK